MADNATLLCIVLLIVIVETLAITSIKEYHTSENIAYFVCAILAYSLVCYLLHQSFYYEGMGMTNVIWSGLSVFLVALVGVLVFKEKVHYHDIFAGSLITAGILIFKYTE